MIAGTSKTANVITVKPHDTDQFMAVGWPGFTQVKKVKYTVRRDGDNVQQTPGPEEIVAYMLRDELDLVDLCRLNAQYADLRHGRGLLPADPGMSAGKWRAEPHADLWLVIDTTTKTVAAICMQSDFAALVVNLLALLDAA